MVSDLFRQPTRRRRRWVLPAVVLLGAVFLLSRYIGDAGSSTLFAEDVRGQSEDLALVVPTFQSLILNLGETDRILLDETILEISETLDAVEAFAVQVVPPDEASDVPVLLEVSIDSWRRGLERFQAALLKAADEVFPTPVEAELIDAFADLRAGDRLYAEMVTRLGVADIPPPVSPLPRIEFFPQVFPMSSTSVTLVAFARAEDSPLKLRAVLGLEQVTSEPAWIVDVQDALVIETTGTLIVKVVIANAGNVESEPTTVGIELFSNAGALQTQVLNVPALAAQSTTTLTTDALDVTQGALYQLLVGLPVANPEVTDPAFGRSFEFRINEEVSTTTSTTEASTDS